MNLPENGGLPPGAQYDPNAPYNEPDYTYDYTCPECSHEFDYDDTIENRYRERLCPICKEVII